MTSPPSQVKAHLQWVKGAGTEMLGSMLSTPLKESGAATKEAAVNEMRAAKEIGDRKVERNIAEEGPMRLSAEGKSEGLFGKVVGCEGMKERGDAKIKAAETKSVN
ncbi:hypothetical protein BZA05DRAFT_444136 [Tricharina praecox]|uniref:uncharacterized protein n=1 Tax=Tricharina praecox TaxID=43433 RepID=UPI002220C56C|nr:uncharacterized protein BZA05DRAFT_444136 [Tricharina praecox]KAI5853863.1 hypothetical protein BZA05DRAFT_444136 [Tricharina praecox]